MAHDKLTWLELRKAVAKNANISEQEAGIFLNALLENVIEGLKADRQVKVKGLGTFSLKTVAPRKSVNIATGETFTIEGYNKINFAPESALKESVEKRINKPKTEETINSLMNDPIKKLGEQADEIVDILADLGQSPETEVQEPIAEAPVTEQAPDSGDDVKQDDNTAAYLYPPMPEDEPAKPKCKKWICWVLLVIVLLSLIGAGIFYRETLVQWWQSIFDRQEVTEIVVEEVTEPVVIPLAQQPREYVNFKTTEKVTFGSRLTWIAYKYYGEKDLWVFIYEANQANIEHANYLRYGQKIMVPELPDYLQDLSNPELRQLVDSLAIEYLK